MITPEVSNLSIHHPCVLVSGSFSVPLSSSLLMELGYVSRVQKERHENITFFTFYLKKHCACESGVTPTTVFKRCLIKRQFS